MDGDEHSQVDGARVSGVSERVEQGESVWSEGNPALVFGVLGDDRHTKDEEGRDQNKGVADRQTKQKPVDQLVAHLKLIYIKFA